MNAKFSILVSEVAIKWLSQNQSFNDFLNVKRFAYIQRQNRLTILSNRWMISSVQRFWGCKIVQRFVKSFNDLAHQVILYKSWNVHPWPAEKRRNPCENKMILSGIPDFPASAKSSGITNDSMGIVAVGGEQPEARNSTSSGKLNLRFPLYYY